MKRRPMGPRKAPMARGKGFPPRSSGLSRRGALNRQSERTRDAVKAAQMPRSASPTSTPHRWPKGLRDAVKARAGGCCDMCGKPLPYRWECHHKRLRAQGGTDEPANLLALDYTCHAYAHEHRVWAKVRGYIVEAGDDPATRPVLRHGHRWQLPTDSGWVDCDPPSDFTDADGVTPNERTVASMAEFKQYRRSQIAEMAD